MRLCHLVSERVHSFAQGHQDRVNWFYEVVFCFSTTQIIVPLRCDPPLIFAAVFLFAGLRCLLVHASYLRQRFPFRYPRNHDHSTSASVSLVRCNHVDSEPPNSTFTLILHTALNIRRPSLHLFPTPPSPRTRLSLSYSTALDIRHPSPRPFPTHQAPALDLHWLYRLPPLTFFLVVCFRRLVIELY